MMEERRDNLINVQDGASFDSEWRGNATATHINQARSQMPQMRSQAQPGLGFVPQSTQPRHLQQITTEERDAARAAGRAHEQQRERMLADARAQREGVRQAAPTRGGGSDAQLASRLAQQEARRAGMY